MTNLREAAQMALQEPKKVLVLRGQQDKVVAIYRENDEEIIRAEMTKEELLKAGAQPEQKPVAWGFQNTGITGSNRWMYLKETIPKEDQYRGVLWTPLYTAPPQREWQGLTPEDKRMAGIPLYYDQMSISDAFDVIERILKEKNT